MLQKKKVIKEQLNNYKHKTQTWKKHMSKSETCDIPQTMINKDTLKHSIAIGLKNTIIAEKLNMGLILAADELNFID